MWPFTIALIAGFLVSSCRGELRLQINDHVFTHSSLVYPLHDTVGQQLGSVNGSFYFFDDVEMSVVCGVVDVFWKQGLEATQALPAQPYLARFKRDDVLIIYDPLSFFYHGCTREVPSELMFAILMHFWKTHVLLVYKAENAALNPFYSRAIGWSAFLEQASAETTRAWLITSSDKAFENFYATWHEKQPIVSALLTIDAIDTNPMHKILDSVWYTCLFQFAMPALYFWIAIRGAQVAVQRRVIGKSSREINVVLVLNISTLAILGTMLVIDAYCARGKFSAEVQNTFRPLLFGTSTAGNFFVALVWTRLLRTMSLVHTSNPSRAWLADKLLDFSGVSLVLLDVLIVLFIAVLRPKFDILFILIPAIATLAQVSVMIFLFRSTNKILATLRSLNVPTVSAKEIHENLIRKLISAIRASILSSIVFIAAFLCLALQSFYFESFAVHVLVNAFLLTSRAVSSFAQVEFCRPVGVTNGRDIQTTAVLPTNEAGTCSTFPSQQQK